MGSPGQIYKFSGIAPPLSLDWCDRRSYSVVCVAEKKQRSLPTQKQGAMPLRSMAGAWAGSSSKCAGGTGETMCVVLPSFPGILVTTNDTEGERNHATVHRHANVSLMLLQRCNHIWCCLIRDHSFFHILAKLRSLRPSAQVVGWKASSLS